MNNIYIKIRTAPKLLLLALTALWSCESLEETYQDFADVGETVYVGAPDSVFVASGYEQVRISAIINADPKITTGVLKSSDGSIDMEFEVVRDNLGRDTLEIDINNIKEGEYRFFLHFRDAKGNKSLEREFNASIAGSDYQKTLTKKSVTGVGYIKNDNNEIGATIKLGKNVDKLREFRIVYTNKDGLEKTVSLGPKVPSTQIFDFKGGTTFKTVSVFDPVNPFTEFVVEDATEHSFPECDELATVDFSEVKLDMGTLNSREEAVSSFVVNSSSDCIDGGITLRLDGDSEWMGLSSDMAGPFGSSLTLEDVSVDQTVYVNFAPNGQVDATHKDTLRVFAVVGFIADASIAISGNETGVPGGIVSIESLAEVQEASSIFTDDQAAYNHGGSVEKFLDNGADWGLHGADNVPAPWGHFTLDLGADYSISEISFRARNACCQNRTPKKYEYWGLPDGIDPASAITTTPLTGNPDNINPWRQESAQKGWLNIGAFEIGDFADVRDEGANKRVVDKLNSVYKVRYLRIVVLESFQDGVVTLNYGGADILVDLDK